VVLPEGSTTVNGSDSILLTSCGFLSLFSC